MKRQTLHYPFCSDLGTKKVIDIKWPEKINLALFKIKQRMNLGGGRTIPDTQIVVPGFYEVQKVELGFWSSFTEKEKTYQTFIAPADYSTGELFYVREKQVKVDIKPEFLQLWKEQPHLIEHATFQFYFLNENLFSANLPFLRINDNYQIEVDWKVRASPSGTFLFFRSGHIFFKWKIEVRQGIVNLNAVKESLEAMMKTAKKAGSKVLKVMSLGMVDLDGSEGQDMDDLAKSMITGKDNWEKMGLNKERAGKVQEQHTERMFKSTYAEALNNPIEPSIFYSNTITFPYNLFDYWLRNEKDPFFCRIYYSNNLFNNLIHNNNQNPITYPLNITFEKLGQILRKGYWQGKLTLDYDPGGKMAECFARGVIFYENKDKSEFPNPNLGVKEIPDQIKYSATGGDNYTAQTIVEPGEGITVNIPYTADQRGYSHSTYIRLTNSSVMDDFKNALVASCGANPNALHYSTSKGFCWGCTYDELNRVNFASFQFTPSSDCSVVLKLDVSSSDTKDLDLKAGTQYTVTISSSQFIFKAQGRTKIILQKVPGHDDFDNLDWTPTGGGGDTEIPLNDPDLGGIDPTDPGIPEPEPDIPTPDIDPGGLEEPEIPPLEPDIPIEPDIPTEPDIPIPDVPPPEPDIPTPEPDPSGDPERPTEPDPGEGDKPEKPEDFD